jgi:Dolichyl-phosphate-mannose-protein mannosyltransferase
MPAAKIAQYRFCQFMSRHPWWTLLIFGLVVFCLVTRGGFSNSDTPRRLQVTHWLWSEQPQVSPGQQFAFATQFRLFSPGWCELTGKNGERYAQFGLGQSLVMLPADVLSEWVARKLTRKNTAVTQDGSDLGDQHRRINQVLVNLITFPLIGAVSLIFSYELLLLLGFSRRVSLAATMLLVVSTTFIVYMQDVQENSLIYFCYVGATMFILRASRGNLRSNLLFAGTLAGYGVLVRMTNIVYLLPLSAFSIYVCAIRLETDLPRLRKACLVTKNFILFFVAPVFIFFGIDRFYNFYRFGEIFSTYMKQCVEFYAQLGGYPPNYPFGYDAISGFFGPFLSPNHSVFLYDAFLVFTLSFVVLQNRLLTTQQKAVVWGALFTLVGLALAFSGTYFWTGGLDWGPRHHLVPAEIACLVGLAFFVRDLRSWGPWTRAAAGLNLVVAIAIQVMALPLRAFIEPLQSNEGDPVGLFLLMRARNIFYFAIGHFEQAGLDYGLPAILGRVAGKEADQLFVFLVADMFSSWSRTVISSLWFLLLLLAAWALVTAVLQGVRSGKEIDSEYDELVSAA